jgi:hypothetical protein
MVEWRQSGLAWSLLQAGLLQSAGQYHVEEPRSLPCPPVPYGRRNASCFLFPERITADDGLGSTITDADSAYVEASVAP